MEHIHWAQCRGQGDMGSCRGMSHCGNQGEQRTVGDGMKAEAHDQENMSKMRSVCDIVMFILAHDIPRQQCVMVRRGRAVRGPLAWQLIASSPNTYCGLGRPTRYRIPQRKWPSCSCSR